MDLKTTELISSITKKNAFQAKSLNVLEDTLSREEKEGLEALISFYVKQGDTIEYLADCYLKLIEDFMEEQLYFVKNGRYRYSSREEMNASIYQNPNRMEYYMKGLAISQYLLEQHRICHKWYCDKISTLPLGGDRWMEVGLGHGENFVQAVRRTNYRHYMGIDISPTSVKISKNMVEQRITDSSKNIEIREQDFFQYDGPVCDAIVMGEILEGVDEPDLFLKKVYEITHENSFIYVTAVVNGRAIDHIHLFKNVEEIEKMYQKAGFGICDKILSPSQGYTMEKAIKKKAAIVTAHVLKRL